MPSPCAVRRKAQNWSSKSTPAIKNEQGYALALVLIAVAFLCFYAGETAWRIKRELMVATVDESATTAYYAAEAGLNWALARARAYAEAPQTNPDPSTLDGLFGTLQWKHPTTNADMSASYSLKVTTVVQGSSYKVLSTGTYTPKLAKYASTRNIIATIQITQNGVPGGPAIKVIFDGPEGG